MTLDIQDRQAYFSNQNCMHIVNILKTEYLELPFASARHIFLASQEALEVRYISQWLREVFKNPSNGKIPQMGYPPPPLSGLRLAKKLTEKS